jgi:hypothetical protein
VEFLELELGRLPGNRFFDLELERDRAIFTPYRSIEVRLTGFLECGAMNLPPLTAAFFKECLPDRQLTTGLFLLCHSL